MSGDQWTREVMYAKIHYSPPKGGALAPPLPPLNPPLIIGIWEWGICGLMDGALIT